MQRAYISKLMELAEADANVLHLVADSGTGFDEMFRRNFPGQMMNFGIAEEHMTAVAAGLATAGKIPFVYTAGAFLAYRALEFIRDDICFQNLNVKIVGMGSGLAWSSLGPSHHTTEDVAVLRAIPNLMILSPATPLQVAACVEEAHKCFGPVYIRIGMNNEKEFFEEGYALPGSGQDILRDDKSGALEEGSTLGQGGASVKRVVIFCTGSILAEVMEAAGLLAEAGIAAEVVNVVRIKPFDEETILRNSEKVDMYVTVEEHNIYGGLGGIVSEILAMHGIGKKLLRIGLNDVFAEGYGRTQESVREANGLDASSIAKTVKKVWL